MRFRRSTKCHFLDVFPSLRAGMLENRGFVCPRQFFARICAQSKAIFVRQKSCLTERLDTELCWSSEKKQICVGIMHLFNGLDLKTGLSPPEGFEIANRTQPGQWVLLWRGHTALLEMVLALAAPFSGCWCLGRPSRLQGAVRLMPTRARTTWEPPGVPLASILSRKQTASSRMSSPAMLLFKQPGCRGVREGIVINLAHDF